VHRADHTRQRTSNGGLSDPGQTAKHDEHARSE
jgi:hypothetical protein